MIKKKSLLRTCVVIAAVLIVCCFATATQANTLYVGACHANGYATITLALAAATPGTIIDVCPGYYAEQVKITLDNITLQGIPYTQGGVTEDAAVIVPPAGGLVANGTIFDTDAGNGTSAFAQIVVQNVTGVIISHITVDAQSSQNCGGGILIGIYYQDSSGTVTDSVARNQITSQQGDQCGWGIAAESDGTGPAGAAPLLTVTNSSVHDFQKNGIVVRGNNTTGPSLTATGNTVLGNGLVASGDAAQNGIEIAFGATGSVRSNYVADMLYPPGSNGTGILFYASIGSPIAESNTVESSNVGIGIYTDPAFGGGGTDATISSNHIGGSQMLDGIDLCGNNEIANSNTIYNSTNSGVHLDDACPSGGSNSTVKSNIINEACAGVLFGPSATADTTSPNTYENDGYEQKMGTNSCTLPTGPNNLVKGKPEGQPAKKAVKPRP